MTVEYNQEENKIKVLCDTYWACTCVGNILLSKYSGYGDDVIDVLEVDDLWLCDATVQFTYGDDRCDYPELKIRITQKCVIETYPSYLNCNNEEGKPERVIYFSFRNPHDTFTFNVMTPIVGGWEVVSDGGHTYFADNDQITVVSEDNENDFIIRPKKCEDETKYIHLKLTKLK